MSSRTILITGANRGIGFGILQSLAQRSPSDHFLLGCRSQEKGEAAIEQLRSLGITSKIDPLVLDIDSDESQRSAAQEVRAKYHKLDVLINNAAVALIPSPDLSDFRTTYNSVLNTNVTSIALSMTLFLPLLKETSSDPRIINVSSVRGSFGEKFKPGYPATVSIPYSISKTTLNALTAEFWIKEENKNVKFHCVCPGFCKTGLNGFRGTKDVSDGAEVVVQLVLAEKERYKNGFWHMEGEDREPRECPW